MVSSETTGDARRGPDPVLWFAFLGGAAAWAVHLFLGWFLEEVVACGTGTVARGEIFGTGVEAWLLGLTAILGGVALAAGVVGYRRWRRAGDEDRAPRAGREAFMGFTGLVGAGLFVPAIVMSGLQVLLLTPCSP